MEKKAVAIGNPVSISGLTLIPVVQVLLNSWHGQRGASYFASKQATAVVVISPEAKRAFRVTGEEISIDQLQQESPEIKDSLEGTGG
jgi:uncharacterized spore protein YtfJ